MARLDAEVKKATHQALIKHNGDRKLAAAELGIEPLKLKDRIWGCPELRKHWGGRRKEPLDPDTAEERRVLPATLGAPQAVMLPEDIEKGLADAEARIAKGLELLPISVDEKDLSKSVHSFQIRHFTAANEIIHGCASLTAIKMTQRLSKMMERHDIILEQMEDEDIPPERLQSLALENDTLLKTIPQFSTELRRLAEMVDKKQIAKAELELRKKEAQAGPKRGKPGFSPVVAVQVQPGGNVSISEPKPAT